MPTGSPIWHDERGFVVNVQEIPLAGGRVTHQTTGTLTGDRSGPSLMLCGHPDTSNENGRPYREAEWTHDPWSGVIADGHLSGLGAINMKAGLAAAMVAADWLWRPGRALRGDLTLAAVAAETGGGVGALHLIASGFRPDLLSLPRRVISM